MVCCRSIALPQALLVAAGEATIHHGGGQCARHTFALCLFLSLRKRDRDRESIGTGGQRHGHEDRRGGLPRAGRRWVRRLAGGAQRRGGAQGVRSKKLHALLFGAKKKKKTLDRLGVGA